MKSLARTPNEPSDTDERRGYSNASINIDSKITTIQQNPIIPELLIVDHCTYHLLKIQQQTHIGFHFLTLASRLGTSLVVLFSCLDTSAPASCLPACAVPSFGCCCCCCCSCCCASSHAPALAPSAFKPSSKLWSGAASLGPTLGEPPSSLDEGGGGGASDGGCCSCCCCCCCTLSTPVTKWQTEHFTLSAPVGYISMMLHPPQTR
mmetsp:Transcript_11894/g.32484  ORF Transcript_11894/g.32484 Transcript_11894/m.32484 type:complete len:206 (+) Transcript_11894:1609-2226(+)